LPLEPIFAVKTILDAAFVLPKVDPLGLENGCDQLHNSHSEDCDSVAHLLQQLRQ
jgi:hypothetical protein